MSVINTIENAIISLDGGSYQKLMDAYLMRKYQFNNIHPLGVQTGTDKTTKGTPDSYVECENGKYIIIMYGSVAAASFSKIESDILSCFDKTKLTIPIKKIDKIICAYTSTNIHIEQIETLKNSINGVKIELIGLGTLAHDIVLKYRFLAEYFLNIPIDTGQVLDIEEFVKQYDAGGLNAPLDLDFVSRREEIKVLKEKIMLNDLIIVSGLSGIGKTKLVIEASKQIRNEHNMQIVCVKNNGLCLYNDVRQTISDPGSYLLFLDDANYAMNLESIFDYCLSKKTDDKINVKIVMTVRDYAKEPIRKLALNKAKFEEIELAPLSMENIQSILKEKLKIKNDYYLKQIVKIANGNIRLAVLAAIAAKKNGFLAINDARDIFHNFYAPIFDENKISEHEIVVLFAISVFGPVMLESHEGVQYILANNNISTNEYINICHRLNECELLDLYENSIVKISDQSFSNYILQYVLIEKKKISIKEILLNLFPKFSSRLIYSINTVIQLFNSDSTLKYVEHEINMAWERCEKHDEKEYVNAFCAVNEEKALLYAKKRINETENVLYELDTVKFPKEVESVYEKDDIVQILTKFGESKQYTMAIDLLLMYFSKRPDVGREICYGITDRMDIDISSNICKYDQQKYLTCQLYSKYQESHNINFAILLVCIIKKFLKYEYHKTEQGLSTNAFTYNTYHLNYSDELIKYRKILFNYLKELRKEGLMCEMVDGIITSLHTGGNDEAKKIFREDVSVLYHLFDDDEFIPDFDLCLAFGKLVEHLSWLAQNTTEIEAFLSKNKEYVIYKNLIREQIKGENWNERNKRIKRNVEQMISNYGDEGFFLLFSICKMRENKKDSNYCDIQRSIENIFELIHDDCDKYLSVMKVYFANDTPYLYRTNDKVISLFKLISRNDLAIMIESLSLENKMRWRIAFYEEYLEEEITINTVTDLVSFIKSQSELDDIQIPSIFHLAKYKNKGLDIVTDIVDVLFKIGKKKPYVIVNFFERILEKEKYEEIIDFFDEDTNKLNELYLIAMENGNFDDEGELLFRLIQIDIKYWDEVTKIVGENNRCNISKDVFDKIWAMDNYVELINIAYFNMRDSYFQELRDDMIIQMFVSSDKSETYILKRKETWIKDCINLYVINELEIVNLFNMITTAFSDKRVEFIMFFIEKNSNVEMFKKIPFFPSSRSWSGSEIPMIEKDINFMEMLLEEISGLNYLEHKLYLKESIEIKKEYKQNVLKEEYIKNFTYI
ncbi:MAG: hypothetical protein RSD51_03670 [Malacoplasma sp.]